MQFKVGENYQGFVLIEEQDIPEIKGTGRFFKHQRTGITLLALDNEDPHKVFSINFKTLPQDNKGTAHIVEHSVCCASQKYPLKETLMALEQGSICTTMNACTYPDRTMYYAASPNEKDLLGVLGVYLDLVFHPAIEMNSHYFLQEGWHYELESLDAPLEVSGVVYHEMLGEYGEASTYLRHYELETMFPDTCYQYDAGGLAEEIVTLTEEDFLAFYHHFYVGNNTILTLYGDLKLIEWLRKLDEDYLKDIPQGPITEVIKKQVAFTKPQYTIAYYPTALKHAPTLLSLCFATGSCIDAQERLGLELLEHILLRSTASPLLKALVMEHQLGISLSDGGYDSCRIQPTFSITLKGSKKEESTLFEEITLKVLKDLVEQGIDRALIDAAIETLSFELMETDHSYEPAGILYSEMMVTSLYGQGNAFAHLNYQKAFDKIKTIKYKGYFEALIKKYFLENNHRVLTLLLPDRNLQIEKERELTKKLARKKSEMSKQELKALMALNERLEAYQLVENSEESLATLPHLTLEDLPKKLPLLTLKQECLAECPIQWHIEDTEEIAYFHFLWDAEVISYEEWPLIGLIAHILTYIGTEKKSFSELENAINTYTGSMNVALHAYQQEKTLKVSPIFKISCKVIDSHLEVFKDLMIELLTQTHFKEKEKLKELMGHIVYELERSFTGAPEYRAVHRAYAYLSLEGRYEDEVTGFAFYQYIKEAYTNYDKWYEKNKVKLEKVYKQLINKEVLKLCITCSEQQALSIRQTIKEILAKLPTIKQSHRFTIEQWVKDHPLSSNEGFINGQDGQAIAQAAYYKKGKLHYKGQLEVVANVLENGYLWDRIRLQGGAYGCDIMLTKEGYVSVCSYCDPNLTTTLTVFSQIGDYLRKIQLSPERIEKAIISTLGALLVPMSMEQKSDRACTYMITGAAQETRQQIYEEIRATTVKDFHEAAHLFDLLGQEGVLCVLGGKEVLEKEKKRLKLIDLKI